MPTTTKILHPEAVNCSHATDKTLCLCRSCREIFCTTCHCHQNPYPSWKECEITKCTNYHYSPTIRYLSLKHDTEKMHISKLKK
jgi:hypothetical protein